MTTTTVSSNYEITLPKELCESMHFQPGQEFELRQFGSIIQLIPKSLVNELETAKKSGSAYRYP